MPRLRLFVPSLLLLPLGGCSRSDPPTLTPVFHTGTPTNRSSTNSWEIGHEPFYTQPGVNGGRRVTLKPIPSQARMEPDDPLALAVFRAIAADGTIPTRYLETSAHNGVVQIVGTVTDRRPEAPRRGPRPRRPRRPHSAERTDHGSVPLSRRPNCLIK